MSELIFVHELIDDGAGEFYAQSFKCMCSNIQPDPDGTPYFGEVFYNFFDIRFNPPHYHAQCMDCLQTYCPYQQCVPPPTAEVIDHNAG